VCEAGIKLSGMPVNHSICEMETGGLLPRSHEVKRETSLTGFTHTHTHTHTLNKCNKFVVVVSKIELFLCVALAVLELIKICQPLSPKFWN
jgi:hypothetical protein